MPVHPSSAPSGVSSLTDLCIFSQSLSLTRTWPIQCPSVLPLVCLLFRPGLQAPSRATDTLAPSSQNHTTLRTTALPPSATAKARISCQQDRDYQGATLSVTYTSQESRTKYFPGRAQPCSTGGRMSRSFDSTESTTGDAIGQIQPPGLRMLIQCSGLPPAISLQPQFQPLFYIPTPKDSRAPPIRSSLRSRRKRHLTPTFSCAPLI